MQLVISLFDSSHYYRFLSKYAKKRNLAAIETTLDKINARDPVVIKIAIATNNCEMIEWALNKNKLEIDWLLSKGLPWPEDLTYNLVINSYCGDILSIKGVRGVKK